MLTLTFLKQKYRGFRLRMKGLEPAILSWNVGVKSLNDEELFFFPTSEVYWIADPFLFHFEEKQYLFVEYFHKLTGKGSIAYSLFQNGAWQQFRECLIENFHLSFPRLIEVNNSIYLSVESSSLPGVRIYSTGNFPIDWVLVNVITPEYILKDPVIFQENDIFHLLGSSNEVNGFSELLHFESNSICQSTWKFVFDNPVKYAKNEVRNGGFFKHNDRFIRVAQHSKFGVYGFDLKLFEIVRPLSHGNYREKKMKNIFFTKLPKMVQFHTLNFSEGCVVFDFKA
jgi:hypothetical protein